MAQRYSDEIKTTVLDALKAELEKGVDFALAQVSQAYGIPKSTIYYWAKGAGLVGLSTKDEKRAELDALLEDKARSILDKMDDDDKRIRDKAVAVGILIDKAVSLRMVMQGQGIGAADWLAHVTISRAGKDSVDTGRPSEGESMATPDAAVPVSTTVGESNLPGSSGESR